MLQKSLKLLETTGASKYPRVLREMYFVLVLRSGAVKGESRTIDSHYLRYVHNIALMLHYKQIR